ncbi:hypothetical protein AB0387_25970 [Streptomyces sp. NPDC089173]|uniref:hypothetical protein n=1 Tax=Streptomyces sp. NPDC089173 TaxID=3154965 RepID=UPI00344F5638
MTQNALGQRRYRIASTKRPNARFKYERSSTLASANQRANELAHEGRKVIVDEWVSASKGWKPIRAVGYRENRPWAVHANRQLKTRRAGKPRSSDLLADLREAAPRERTRRLTPQQKRRIEADRIERLIRYAKSETPIDQIRKEAIRAAGPKATGPVEDGHKGVRGYSGAPSFRRFW